MSARSKIPSEVALQLRKEAGFGCCNCGCPIIEYHHIIPWEEREHFEPEHMMALCPTCHAIIGNKSRVIQYNIKQNPYNIKQNKVSWEIPVLNNEIAIRMGGMSFIGEGQILRVDNDRLLELHVNEGLLEISIDLRDKEGRILASIDRNQWESDLINVFDIVHTQTELRIKAKKGEISLKITMEDSIVTIGGTFFWNGQIINIQSSRISINGQSKRIGLNENILVGNTCLHILSSTKEYFLVGQPYFDDDHIASLIPIICSTIENKETVTIYTKKGQQKKQ